jgi:hypothetical protein
MLSLYHFEGYVKRYHRNGTDLLRSAPDAYELGCLRTMAKSMPSPSHELSDLNAQSKDPSDETLREDPQIHHQAYQIH